MIKVSDYCYLWLHIFKIEWKCNIEQKMESFFPSWIDMPIKSLTEKSAFILMKWNHPSYLLLQDCFAQIAKRNWNFEILFYCFYRSLQNTSLYFFIHTYFCPFFMAEFLNLHSKAKMYFEMKCNLNRNLEFNARSMYDSK